MPKSKRLREMRRSARREMLAALTQLNDDDLRNIQCEFGREFNQKATALNEIRARMECVKLERQRRSTATSAGIHITDHAVVRYLERVKGMDIAAIREEIVALATASGKLGSKDRYARHECDGTDIVLGFNEIDGTVTTVFTKDENEMMEVVS
jgi:hypothetical protein